RSSPSVSTPRPREPASGAEAQAEAPNSESPVASDDMGLKALLDQHSEQMRRMHPKSTGWWPSTAHSKPEARRPSRETSRTSRQAQREVQRA
ncbi:hypothetical protein THAOC_37594, partial [Thalassiosira oceanica]